MKKYLKSYLTFTSLIYRIVMFNVMPLVLIGIVAYGGYVWSNGRQKLNYAQNFRNPWIAECVFYLSIIIIPFVEILSDNWLFGGIQSKQAEKMDYLKTSAAGMRVLHNALCMDLIRRFISTVVIPIAAYAALVLPLPNKLDLHNMYYISPTSDYRPLMPPKFRFFTDVAANLYIVLIGCLVAYFISVLGVVISRYGSMLWINLIVAYAMAPFSIIVVYILYQCRHVVELIVGIFPLLTLLLGPVVPLAVLDAAISVFTVRKAMKKMEESYYDK